jgi:hypothetical protein
VTENNRKKRVNIFFIIKRINLHESNELFGDGDGYSSEFLP